MSDNRNPPMTWYKLDFERNQYGGNRNFEYLSGSQYRTSTKSVETHTRLREEGRDLEIRLFQFYAS